MKNDILSSGSSETPLVLSGLEKAPMDLYHKLYIFFSSNQGKTQRKIGNRGWAKEKYTDVFKSGGKILGRSASKAFK